MDQWCCQSSPEAALYGRYCQQMPFPSFIFAQIFPNFFLTPSRILKSNFFYNKSALGFADLSTVFDLAFFNALVLTFLLFSADISHFYRRFSSKKRIVDQCASILRPPFDLA